MEARAVATPQRAVGDSAGFDAVILAGGRGSRLGGVSKGEIEVGGHRLVDIAVDAALHAGASHVIVVGSVHVEAPAVVIHEDPPFGGPAAGLAAALPTVSAPRLLLLACDLPRAAELVAMLLGSGGLTPLLNEADQTGVDGVVIVDAAGRTQWLAGMYRTQAVSDALDAASAQSGVYGLPLRRLLERLDLTPVHDERRASDDIDTPEQLLAARERAGCAAPPTAGPR